jgi:hypothetical protein
LIVYLQHNPFQSQAQSAMPLHPPAQWHLCVCNLSLLSLSLNCMSLLPSCSTISSNLSFFSVNSSRYELPEQPFDFTPTRKKRGWLGEPRPLNCDTAAFVYLIFNLLLYHSSRLLPALMVLSLDLGEKQ